MSMTQDPTDWQACDYISQEIVFGSHFILFILFTLYYDMKYIFCCPRTRIKEFVEVLRMLQKSNYFW